MAQLAPLREANLKSSPARHCRLAALSSATALLWLANAAVPSPGLAQTALKTPVASAPPAAASDDDLGLAPLDPLRGVASRTKSEGATYGQDDFLPDPADPSSLPASRAANYGKPKPPAPARKKAKPAPFAHPLPPLQPYPTSAVARRQQKEDAARRHDAYDPSAAPPAPFPPPTVAVPETPPRRPRPRADDDPFAPVGVNVGLLRVKPYAETDFGYADNPNFAPKGSPQLRGSVFMHDEIGAAAASDWSNHSFTGDFKLGYDEFFADHAADTPSGAGKFKARIDVLRDTQINIDGKFDLTTQNPSSPNLDNNGQPVTLKSRPIIADGGMGLGVSHLFNRLELGLRAGFDRVYWQDAQFADGSTQALSKESYDAISLTPRASYELTPGVKPFVEATVDRRVHDTPVDENGYYRDSDGVAAKAGSTFELTRLLTGDIAGGYAQRHYQDARLPDLRGPTFDASLVWTATPLTKVTLRGSTTMDETSVAGSSGAVTRTTGLEISHALLRNLTIAATGGVTRTDYKNVPTEQTLAQAGLKLEYNLTRTVAIKGSFTTQRMTGNPASSDYTANIVMVGLKIQQ